MLYYFLLAGSECKDELVRLNSGSPIDTNAIKRIRSAVKVGNQYNMASAKELKKVLALLKYE